MSMDLLPKPWNRVLPIFAFLYLAATSTNRLDTLSPGFSGQGPDATFISVDLPQPKELFTVLQINPVCLDWNVRVNLTFCPNRLYLPAPAVQPDPAPTPPALISLEFIRGLVPSDVSVPLFFLRRVKRSLKHMVVDLANGPLAPIGARLVINDQGEDDQATNTLSVELFIFGVTWAALYYAFCILIVKPWKKYALPIIVNLLSSIYSSVIFNNFIQLSQGGLVVLQRLYEVYGFYMADSSPDADVKLLLQVGALVLCWCGCLWRVLCSLFRRNSEPTSKAASDSLIGFAEASDDTKASVGSIDSDATLRSAHDNDDAVRSSTPTSSSIKRGNRKPTLHPVDSVNRLSTETPVPPKRTGRRSASHASSSAVSSSIQVDAPVRRADRRPTFQPADTVGSSTQGSASVRRANRQPKPVIQPAAAVTPSSTQASTLFELADSRSPGNTANVICTPAQAAPASLTGTLDPKTVFPATNDMIGSSTPGVGSINRADRKPIVKPTVRATANLIPSFTQANTLIERADSKPAENPAANATCTLPQAAPPALIRTLDSKTLIPATYNVIRPSTQAVTSIKHADRKPIVQPVEIVIPSPTQAAAPIEPGHGECAEQPAESAIRSPAQAAAIALIRTLDSKTLFPSTDDVVRLSAKPVRLSDPQCIVCSAGNIIATAPRNSQVEHEDKSMVHVIPLPTGIADQSLLVYKSSRSRDVLGIEVIAQIHALRRRVGPEGWKSLVDGLSLIGQLKLLQAFYPRGNLSRYMWGLGGCLDRRLAKVYLVETFSALLAIHNIGIVHGRLSQLTLVLKDDGHLILSNVALSGTVDLKFVNGDTRMAVFLLAAQDPRELSADARKLIREAISDFYGMGVVYYRMITGRAPPFLPSAPNKTFDQPDHLQNLTEQDQSFLSLLFDNCLRKRYSVQDLKSHPIFDDVDWEVDRQSISVPPPRPVVRKKPRRPALEER